MCKISQKTKLFVALLLISPLLISPLYPILMVPAFILSLIDIPLIEIIPRDCNHYMCAAELFLVIVPISSVIVAYILSLSFYLLNHRKEELRKKIIVAVLLFLYYAVWVSILFRSALRRWL